MIPDLTTFGDAASGLQKQPNPNEAKLAAVASAVFSGNTALALDMRPVVGASGVEGMHHDGGM